MSSPSWKKVHWIYWLALLWFSAYLLLTLSWWQQNIKEREEIRHLEQLLPWVEPVQQLVRQLQTERGLSAGKVTPALSYEPALQIQYLLTDAAFRDLVVSLEQQKLAPGTTQLQYFVQQNPLPALRQQVIYAGLDSVPLDGASVIKAYSDLIKPLLQFLQPLHQEAGSQWQQHSLAIAALTEAIERAGLERAMLHIANAEQQMSASRYQNYVIVVNERLSFIEIFQKHSPAHIQQRWLAWKEDAGFKQLTQWREQALAQEFTVPPEQWFLTATKHINFMYQLEHQLQLQLSDELQQAGLALELQMEQLQLRRQLMAVLLLGLLWRMYRLQYRQTDKQQLPGNKLHNLFSG